MIVAVMVVGMDGLRESGPDQRATAAQPGISPFSRKVVDTKESCSSFVVPTTLVDLPIRSDV